MARAIKAAVVIAALIPAGWLAWALYSGADLGANPAETLQLQTGIWALRFLLIALAITPIRRVTGWNRIIQYRRMLGLFAFFYATLHMLTWVVFVHFFDLKFMVEDIAERPYITVGMATFLMLLALAVTSNRLSIRKLGRRWQKLHRLVYVAAIGGVIHFWWLVKADTSEPQRWAIAVAALLGFRVWWAWRSKPTQTRAPRPA